MEKISGVPAAQVVGKLLMEPFPWVKETNERYYLDRALAGESITSEILAYKGAAGIRYFETHYSPFREDSGEIVGAISICREVTARVARSVAMEDVTSQLARAVTPEEVAKILVDNTFPIVQANGSAIILWQDDRQNLELIASHGYSQASIDKHMVIPPTLPIPIVEVASTGEVIYGHSVEEFLDKYPYVATIEGPNKAFAAIPLVIENRIIGALGLGFKEAQLFNREERACIETLAGQAAQALERSRLFEREKSARAAAEAASVAKTRFLANVSHEIRTPLTAIMGYAELLNTVKNPEKQSQYTCGILRNGQSLLNIVDDVLDLAKIESGRIKVQSDDVSLTELIAEIVNVTEHLIGQKQIELRFEIQDDVPETIVTDGNRLKQILLNLAGNAVKFTPSGVIAIRVLASNLGAPKATLGSGDDSSQLVSDRLCFLIEDSGLGISLSDQKQLFEPFNQGQDTRRKSSIPGSGLGLAISQRLAQAMGGNLVLSHSALDQGSVFLLNLPLIPSANAVAYSGQQTYRAPDAKRLAGRKLLVVEDQPDLQQLAVEILSHYGATVSAAANGADGLKELQQNVYDIVLMDLQMPVMDGFEAIARFRTADAKTPVIALSAHALDEYRTRALQAGFNEHVTKPTNFETLVKTIETLLAS